jgi:hypothetical protein
VKEMQWNKQKKKLFGVFPGGEKAKEKKRKEPSRYYYRF